MVRKEVFVYLFVGRDIVGQDGLSKKQATLKEIKESLLSKTTEDFNLDTLYSKDLTLKNLQEKLLCLPFKSKRRIIVIKEAQGLKEDMKEFILRFAKKPEGGIILVLDIEQPLSKDNFVKELYNYAKVYRFNEPARLDTFALSRSIDQRRPEQALRILSELLQDGEKPERILGGLRFAWEKAAASPSEVKKRLQLLLNCDLDIKTGKLKPFFALEKLIISLCSLGKPFG